MIQSRLREKMQDVFHDTLINKILLRSVDRYPKDHHTGEVKCVAVLHTAHQSFDEQISSFVRELVSSGDEEIKGFVQVKIVVSVKMTTNEIVNLLFRYSVQILREGRGTDM